MEIHPIRSSSFFQPNVPIRTCVWKLSNRIFELNFIQYYERLFRFNFYSRIVTELQMIGVYSCLERFHDSPNFRLVFRRSSRVRFAVNCSNRFTVSRFILRGEIIADNFDQIRVDPVKLDTLCI